MLDNNMLLFNCSAHWTQGKYKSKKRKSKTYKVENKIIKIKKSHLYSFYLLLLYYTFNCTCLSLKILVKLVSFKILIFMPYILIKLIYSNTFKLPLNKDVFLNLNNVLYIYMFSYASLFWSIGFYFFFNKKSLRNL